jgi:hypothetical protein
LAAEQGSAIGQLQLGIRYYLGKGVPKDYFEAVRWYRKAAEQGDAGGQQRLGLMYDQGYGVPQDYDQAVSWYRKAAEHEHETGQVESAEVHSLFIAEAQYDLGIKYYRGEGVSQDYVQAHMWLNLAASHSGDQSYSQMRDDCARKMTPEQIAEAQRLAHEWKPKASR